MTGHRPQGTQKITLRLFFIFVLFILLPTAALSGFAVSYIASESQTQVERMLSGQATAMRASLLGRLGLVEERLRMFSATLQDQAHSSGSSLLTEGLEFEHLPFDGDLVSRSGHKSPMQAIRSGRVLVVPKMKEGEVFVFRAVNPRDPERGIALTTLNNNLVLGEPELRDLRFERCVYDSQGRTLFYSDRAVCDRLRDGLGDRQGVATVSRDGTAYMLGHKQVFMEELYGNDTWTVAVALPKSSVLEASKLFEKRYLALAAMTILSLALVSIRLIRRQMAPLATLMQGIERVSNRDYKYRVEVQSGDEFEDMALAFNSMSERVSHQMRTMASMSEIDQLILSRVKKEDIIRITLERTSDIIAGGPVFLLLMEKNSAEAALFYQVEDSGPLPSIKVPFTEEQVNRALDADYFTLSSTDGLTRSLRSLRALTPEREDGHFLVLPIRLKTELVALLLIARDDGVQLDPDQETVMLDYASRIAVALANAEWEDRLYRQAHFDTLTGLPNRHALRGHLDQAIVRARRESETFGVLFIDLDNFKLINDALGHSLGDEFLQEVAKRLSHALREDDFVSRLGGDEFVIVSSSTPSNSVVISSMNEIARKVQLAASTPVNLQGQDLRGSSSVGIALYPKDGEDAESLLKNADTAMYKAKSIASGGFHYFSEDLNKQSHTLMQLSMELRVALEQDQFLVHFQPKVDVQSGKIVGAEALIRWHHPDRGMVPPGAFIEAAESLGLINSIGDWVLHAVCRQLQDWTARKSFGMRIAVNISADQIQKEGFAEKIQQLLEDYQISGDVLELEITEGAIIEEVKGTVATLVRLRSMGVNISIDDYGTGYSSLAYLKQFPVDTLKIDGSFIFNLADSSADRAIVESTIVLARRLGLKTIAEGVEEAEQVAILKSFNCDQIQGYFYSPPVPAAEFEVLLKMAEDTGQAPQASRAMHF